MTRGEPLVPTLIGEQLFPEVPDSSFLEDNLRLAGMRVLDVLQKLGTSTADAVPTPSAITELGEESRRYLNRLLRGLQLAHLDEGNDRLCVDEGAVALRAAWTSCATEVVVSQLLRYGALAEAAGLKPSTRRPQGTLNSARNFGRLVGVVWETFPGGANPTIAQVQDAIRQALRGTERGSLTILELLTVVFPSLHVSPARIIRGWESFRDRGMFEPFALRRGGTSTGDHTVEVLRIRPGGAYVVTSEDLETLGGYRDISIAEPRDIPGRGAK